MVEIIISRKMGSVKKIVDSSTKFDSRSYCEYIFYHLYKMYFL